MAKRVVPAKEVEVVDKVTCDLCGCEIPNGCGNVNETRVSHRTGYSYPEGGHGDLVAFDICGDCFETKLRPWLESQGAVAMISEWGH